MQYKILELRKTGHADARHSLQSGVFPVGEQPQRTLPPFQINLLKHPPPFKKRRLVFHLAQIFRSKFEYVPVGYRDVGAGTGNEHSGRAVLHPKGFPRLRRVQRQRLVTRQLLAGILNFA